MHVFPTAAPALRRTALALAIAHVACAHAAAPYAGNEVEARVGAMIDNMSLAQKINFIRVDDGHMLPLLPSQGLYGTTAYDSSMGVHVNNGTFGAQYPSQSALAATWSINRARQFGLAIGYETRQAGAQQMLSPGLNMYRTPYNGRAAEYLSGEDPFLGAVLGPAVTNAIQAQGIQASAKHFVANDVEANRHLLDVTVDERTLREIYLPGFESTVKNAAPASVMCAFNKINGDYGCESHHLITEVLKGEWGFQGFVMSDFNSIHHPQKAAWAGTDLDMPTGLAFNEANMYDLIYSNQVPMVVLDDKVRRNLRAMVSYGFDKGIPAPTPLDTAYGDAASLAVAREAIVLLKNEATNGSMPLLPLTTNARIAVIGDMAQQPPASPFGTAWSPPNRYVTALNGLQQFNVDTANVTYIPALSLNPAESVWYQPGATAANAAPGLKAEYFANTNLAGTPAATRIEPGVAWDFMTGRNVTANGSTALAGFSPTPGAFSARFSGTIRPTVTGAHVFKVRADGAYKLWVNGELVLDFDGAPISADVINTLSRSGKTGQLKAGQLYTVKLEYRRTSGAYFPVLGSINGVQMSWASLAAPASLAGYDAVVVAAGVNAEYEGEAIDRPFDLPEYQSDLIAGVAKVNPNTIVVMHGGGPSNMLPWSKKAAAVLQAWYPGQFGGQALAEILYGKVNPSGKLPVTIGSSEADYPSYASYGAIADYQPAGTFPDAASNTSKKTMTYADGVFMGYRGFDKAGTKPLYPFGFGLSYTTFGYSDLKLSGSQLTAGATVDATFTLTNRGRQDGFEVAQLYVRPVKPTVARPLRELKGFAKVFLRAGESKQVTIPVDARSLAYYVPASGAWQVDAGKFHIEVGGSSRDLPMSQTLSVPAVQQLSTGSSNPLPASVRQAVQVAAGQAY
ncbi:glycosyl hydrolase family 3 [Pseudoduganella plicata]|uniref:Beta-D-glucoside glucohydrolase n=2 Tax=Pseudoduganella plicata TaxID=321984 RepID=A0A4P7BK22_9BURK|nr:glycosyl hydrolase family 3 [Pseudoduganella plicata]GGY95552.1 glycosyl hydrolase family 3 [Pseudoduganella plicata]